MQKNNRSYTALIIFLALTRHLITIDQTETPPNIQKDENCNACNEHHSNKADTTPLKDTTEQIKKETGYKNLSDINFSTENKVQFETDKAKLDAKTISDLLSYATEDIKDFDILNGISSYFLPMKIRVINTDATSKFIQSNSPTQQEIEAFNNEFKNADDFYKQFIHPIIWSIQNLQTFDQLTDVVTFYDFKQLQNEFMLKLDEINEGNHDPLKISDVLNLISLSYIEHNLKEKHFSYILELGDYYNPKKESFCLNIIEKSVKKFEKFIDIKNKESHNLNEKEAKKMIETTETLKNFIKRSEEKLKDIKKRFIPGLEQNLENFRTNDKLELNIPFYNAKSLKLEHDEFYKSFLNFLELFFTKLFVSNKEEANRILLRKILLINGCGNAMFCIARRYTSKIVMENTIEFMRYITYLKRIILNKIEDLEKEGKDTLNCDKECRESKVVEPNKSSCKLSNGLKDEGQKSYISNEDGNNESRTNEKDLKIEIGMYKGMENFLKELLHNTKTSLEKANLLIEFFNKYISLLPFLNPIKDKSNNSSDNKRTENIVNEKGNNSSDNKRTENIENDKNEKCDYTNELCDDTNELCDDTNGKCDYTNELCDDTNELYDDTNGKCNYTNGKFYYTNGKCDYTNGKFYSPNKLCDDTNGKCDDTDELCDDTNGKWYYTNGKWYYTNGKCDYTNGKCYHTNGKCDYTNGKCDEFKPSFSVEISNIKSEDDDREPKYNPLTENTDKSIDEVFRFESIKIYYIVAYKYLEEISNSEGVSADELYAGLKSFGS